MRFACDPMMAIIRTPTVLVRLLLVVGVAACSIGDVPTPTGTTCPPEGTTLTYDKRAKPFMEMHCTRCHSSELHGADRHGAPFAHDFDTEVGILNVHEHVDEQAAAGPNAINRFMPEDGESHPTDEDRYNLGLYLACRIGTFGRPDARPVDAAMPDAALVDAQ